MITSHGLTRIKSKYQNSKTESEGFLLHEANEWKV